VVFTGSLRRNPDRFDLSAGERALPAVVAKGRSGFDMLVLQEVPWRRSGLVKCSFKYWLPASTTPTSIHASDRHSCERAAAAASSTSGGPAGARASLHVAGGRRRKRPFGWDQISTAPSPGMQRCPPARYLPSLVSCPMMSWARSLAPSVPPKTCWQARLARADNVLVVGASGGVGTAAVQLAKRRRAKVTAVAQRSKWLRSSARR
jgi:hypothetical protein